jgi:hypothetical protein
LLSGFELVVILWFLAEVGVKVRFLIEGADEWGGAVALTA